MPALWFPQKQADDAQLGQRALLDGGCFREAPFCELDARPAPWRGLTAEEAGEPGKVLLLPEKPW